MLDVSLIKIYKRNEIMQEKYNQIVQIKSKIKSKIKFKIKSKIKIFKLKENTQTKRGNTLKKKSKQHLSCLTIKREVGRGE